MSIANCKRCKVPYWRYRRDFPPSGYCSLPCAELGPVRKDPPPPKPDTALSELRAHRITMHRDPFYLQWYDCTECERLEGIYMEALGYWMDHPVNSGGAEKTPNPYG